MFRSQRENHVLATLFFWKGIPGKPKTMYSKPYFGGESQKNQNRVFKTPNFKDSQELKNPKFKSTISSELWISKFETLNGSFKLWSKVWTNFETLVVGPWDNIFLKEKLQMDSISDRNGGKHILPSLTGLWVGDTSVLKLVSNLVIATTVWLLEPPIFLRVLLYGEVADWICVWQFLMFRTVFVFFSSSDLQIAVPSWTPF